MSHTSRIIHPTAVIGDEVDLADGVSVGPFAVILGPTVIGRGSTVDAGAMIGGPPEVSTLPQHRGWNGEAGYHGVRIGENVVVRERVVIHQGSVRTTLVGNGCWILNGAYLAHDVRLGERVTVSAGVSVGGHVEIDDEANIGLNAAVHQRRTIGRGAMVGMSTPVTMDVPPFAKVYGSPPRTRGVNAVTLRRAGVSDDIATQLAHALLATDDPAGLDFTAVSAPLAEAWNWWTARVVRTATPSAPSSHGGRRS